MVQPGNEHTVKRTARIARHCVIAATALLVAGCGGRTFLPAAIESPPSYENGMAYAVTLEGDMNESLRTLLSDTSELVSLVERPPFGHAGLRQRAQQDMDRLLRVLHAEGYYAAGVNFEIRSDASPAQVTVRVDTGTVFLLEDYIIRYRGDSASTDGVELPRDIEPLGLHIGTPARSAVIVQAQKNLLVELENTGRPFAAVVDRKVLVDHERTTVRVDVDVDLGAMAHFGETSIAGNTGVDTAYLQKLIPWKPGKTFAKSDLDVYRARLAATGLFERVQVASAPEAAVDGSLAVAVHVEERPHRSIGVGASYSTDRGPSTDAYWEHRNLWGRQEWLRVSANASMDVQTLSTDVRKPHFRILDQHLLFNANANRETSTAFDERSLSTFAGVERKKWSVWTLRGGPSLEYSSLLNRDTLDRTNFALVGLPLSAHRDTTDDLLDPRQGNRLAFLATPYVGTITSNVSFLSAEANGSAYQPVDGAAPIVFAERFRVGAVVGETTDMLPANKRLYAGGGGSVRGFKHRMVGPITANGAPSGGRSVVELGLESRIKVAENVGVVPFVEGGGVYDGISPRFPNNTLWAGGLGLRYHTIAGPLRADLAFPLNGRAGIDSVFEFYISIGQAF